VVTRHPLRHGLAELVAYLQLAGEWPKTAVDDEVQEQVSWQLETGVMRQATLPRIILLRIDDECCLIPTSNHSARPTHELSSVVVPLLKGVLYQEENPGLWGSLLNLQASVRDYVAVLGLELMLDEAEGYAFLRSRQDDDEDSQAAIPRLVARRQLSYPVSLLLALLRKKLAEFDASGGDTRLILSRDEVVELIRIFLPCRQQRGETHRPGRCHLNKIAELGFIRRLRGQGQMIEVRRIIKAFVDAQWLADFDQRLAEYRQQLDGGMEGDEDG
jgi:hypothetical protein